MVPAFNMLAFCPEKVYRGRQLIYIYEHLSSFKVLATVSNSILVLHGNFASRKQAQSCHPNSQYSFPRYHAALRSETELRKAIRKQKVGAIRVV